MNIKKDDSCIDLKVKQTAVLYRCQVAPDVIFVLFFVGRDSFELLAPQSQKAQLKAVPGEHTYKYGVLAFEQLSLAINIFFLFFAQPLMPVLCGVNWERVCQEGHLCKITYADYQLWQSPFEKWFTRSKRLHRQLTLLFSPFTETISSGSTWTTWHWSRWVCFLYYLHIIDSYINL